MNKINFKIKKNDRINYKKNAVIYIFFFYFKDNEKTKECSN